MSIGAIGFATSLAIICWGYVYHLCLAASLEALRGRLARQEQRIDALRGRLARQEQRIDALEAELRGVDKGRIR